MLGRTRSWPVSISIAALMPARNGGSSGSAVNAKRTGSRCTTLTQLPEEFWAGRRANSAPVAGLMEATTAVHVRLG